jgi:hypothetical protein
MQRLSSLAPGMAYHITLIVENDHDAPFWMVTSLGKIEGIAIARKHGTLKDN